MEYLFSPDTLNKEFTFDILFTTHAILMDRLHHERGMFKTEFNYTKGADFDTVDPKEACMVMKQWLDNVNDRLDVKERSILFCSAIRFFVCRWGECGMRKILLKAVAIIALLTIVGCSNSINENDENTTDSETPSFYFTGTIKEIYDGTALVDGTRGKVFVTLTVNNNEVFHVGDKVRVGYNGTIMESNPAQIETLSVERVDD